MKRKKDFCKSSNAVTSFYRGSKSKNVMLEFSVSTCFNMVALYTKIHTYNVPDISVVSEALPTEKLVLWKGSPVICTKL